MAIEAVLLDVGGVLTVPDYRLLEPVLRAAGLEPDELAVVRGHYAGMVAMDGDDEAILDAYLEAMARACGAGDAILASLVADLAGLWDEPALWRRALPGAVEGLRRLAATGVAIAMVSNSDGYAAESLRVTGICQVGPGPGVAVGAIIDSHVVGVAKPDPRIFAIALDAVGVSAEQAVHVGDAVRYDVRGAQRAGVRALHLDPFDLCPGREDHTHVRSLDEVAGLVG